MSERIQLSHPDLETTIFVDRKQAQVLAQSGWVESGGKVGFIEDDEPEPVEAEFSDGDSQILPESL